MPPATSTPVPSLAETAGGFSFTVTARDQNSKARTGLLQTPRGAIQTPYYVFCGTKAAIKGLAPSSMQQLNTQIILANTYHLLVQPGTELIRDQGGLHPFTGWSGPMMTDSGGYQIFAMQHGSISEDIKGKTARPVSVKRIDEQGALFTAYTDGRDILLTPELAISAQAHLGAELVMPLDECTAVKNDYDYTARSLEITHRWEDRSLAEFERLDMSKKQRLYGIVQGSCYPDLRRIACDYTKSRPFFGTAIGGALGKSKDEMYEILGFTMPHVHAERPVHLLGIGDIPDVLAGVALGIDAFDCVMPTRLGRHGWALVPQAAGNKINLRNARFRCDSAPIDAQCHCPTCTNHSRAYLHHLLNVEEMLGPILITQHNVFTLNRLMSDIRQSIPRGTLPAVAKAWLPEEPSGKDAH